MARRPFGEIIAELAGLTPEQIEQAVKIGRETGEPLGEVLVNLGLITEKQRAQALGQQWGIPFRDLEEQPPEEQAAEWLPLRLCEKHTVVPVALNNHRLTLAMARPFDLYAIDEIKLATGYDVVPLIAAEEDIHRTIARLYRTDQQVGEVLSDLAKDIEGVEIEVEEKPAEEEVSISELRSQAEEAPVVRMVNMIVLGGLREGASDIHVQPEADRVRVRYRIDGVMQDHAVLPKKIQKSVISRLKIMADMDIANKRTPQDGRISLRVDGRDYDFRVSTLPGINGEKVVMRILDKGSLRLGLNKLGLSLKEREQMERLITRPYGMILVTGPTGSGKSTTLYSLLNRLNTGEKNILTIEDPVEYEVPGLTQVQVNEKAGMTFASGLRTMLRQDPDIIMVGEIRDSETALIATEAALTGHLVLSTLHTNDAPGAVSRLIEMGIEPFLVASALIAVEAQRLVRVICDRCKVAYNPPEGALKRLGPTVEELEEVVFYKGEGCPACRDTGYKGRIGVFELMVIDDRLRALILDRAPTQAIRQAAIEAGMVTLQEDAVRKVLQGITTVEEALRVIYVE
ncbi:MAG TPA: type II/IV secretion system protein [Armatimonadetes bacterium]|nr:type II/IV secretion system protein [Armatimonadota bacterium]